MKKLMIAGALVLSVALGACKGNGSTKGSNDTDSVSLNDGTGAPGSGTGSAGQGTVGDTTKTEQDTVHGAPQPKSADTTVH